MGTAKLSHAQPPHHNVCSPITEKVEVDGGERVGHHHLAGWIERELTSRSELCESVVRLALPDPEQRGQVGAARAAAGGGEGVVHGAADSLGHLSHSGARNYFRRDLWTSTATISRIASPAKTMV